MSQTVYDKNGNLSAIANIKLIETDLSKGESINLRNYGIPENNQNKIIFVFGKLSSNEIFKGVIGGFTGGYVLNHSDSLINLELSYNNVLKYVSNSINDNSLLIQKIIVIY